MKVLVVEDEPLIRLGIVSLVEDAGVDVRDAPDADVAIAVLEGDPQIGVVVTDIDMPGSMDGIGLARVVAKRWPLVRVIAMSGKVAVDQSTLPPGVRYFSKPVPEGQLLAAISAPPISEDRP